MMGPVCSIPDCTAAAVLQWQRAGTEQETASYAAGIGARLAAISDHRRTSLLLEIADLADRQERLTSSGKVSRSVLAAAEAQLAARQADLDGLPEPVTPAVEPVTVTVHGCEQHAVDLESAARLHDAGCMTAGPCGCSLPN